MTQLLLPTIDDNLANTILGGLTGTEEFGSRFNEMQ